MTNDELIRSVRLNEANIDYIMKHNHRNINGTLYSELNRILNIARDDERKKITEQQGVND